jgi:hypothetical protein
MPLILAASLALLVVVGAVVTHFMRADLSPEKQAAAKACEAEYKSQFPDGPGLVGGDIYSAAEWQDLNAALVRLGAIVEQTLTGEQISAKNDAAAAVISNGGDTMTLLWQRDDRTNAQCVAEMRGGSVTLVTVTTLATPDASATPTPSPSS